MSTVLQVTNLSKKYISNNGIETVAMKGLSLSIEANEMVAVMGSSGSGKTTLINILTGLVEADSGSVQINGRDYLHMDKEELARFRREEIGIVFQNYNLIDSLTVNENIRVPLILDQRTEDQDEKVRSVASMLGIEGELEKYPYEISGGQQQRAGICRAIINEPKIIFADEPTGNLDAQSTKQVMEYFVKACKTQGASLLMVTIVFLMCAFLTCGFKLQSEQEMDHRKMILLTSIGANCTVISKYIRDKLGAAVIWPFYIAWIWVMFLTVIYGCYSTGLAMTLTKTFSIGMVIWLLLQLATTGICQYRCKAIYPK